MNQDSKTGTGYTLAAFLMWGILPLYWQFLDNIPALQILAHRIIWSFVFVALLISIQKKWRLIGQAFRSQKNILVILGCAVLITINWFTYIWAVNHDHVIETSLGYYINPLLNIALGMIFFREKLTKWQWIALLLAIIGVGIQTVEYGQFPWIALSLAFSFGLYGLLKKILKVEAMISLALETITVAPFALAYLLYVEGSDPTVSITNISLTSALLLVSSGVVTALPLIWFAEGAKRIRLSTVGFLQYLSPTIILTLGIFFFHEPFHQSNFISFLFIWLAILIYTLSQIYQAKVTARST